VLGQASRGGHEEQNPQLRGQAPHWRHIPERPDGRFSREENIKIRLSETEVARKIEIQKIVSSTVQNQRTVPQTMHLDAP